MAKPIKVDKKIRELEKEINSLKEEIKRISKSQQYQTLTWELWFKRNSETDETLPATRALNGKIGEVRICNRDLSEEEIKQILDCYNSSFFIKFK